MATVKGICFYKPKTEIFVNFNTEFKLNHILGKVSIRKITEDQQGNIWIITDENGIFRFNPKTKAIKSYYEKANNFIEFEKAADGKFWLLSDQDMYLFDPILSVFKAQNIKKSLGFTNKNVLRAIVSDKDANLWLGTYQEGIYVFSPQGKLIKNIRKSDDPKGLSSNEIKCFMRDSKDRIWVGTRNAGISVYLPENDSFVKISNSKTDSKSLGKNYVLSFFEDRQANIWVGLSGGGFDKYDPLKYPFGIIEQNSENFQKGLSDNMVFKVFGQGKYLYFGTQAGGLSRLDTSSQTFTTFKPIANKPSSILHSEVYDISADAEQNLWLATGRGLCQYFPQQESFKSYLQTNNDLSLYLFAARVLKNNKELWAGGQRGIFRFDLGTKKWKDWDDLPALINISKYVVRVIYEDAQENVWFGTLGHGLIKYAPKTQQVTVFDDKNGLKCANIRSIYEDKNSIWVGSDCGLFKISSKQDKIQKHYSIKNGLVNNVIYGIVQDQNQNYWLSSNKGLMKFSESKGLLKAFTQNDGLSSNEFNSNCTYKASNGTLYFGSIAGITHFDPNKLKANTYSPAARIIQMKVNNTAYIPNSQILKLSYTQNFVDFEYSNFNFSNTESNTYQHQLIGIENQWVDQGTQHVAHYTNLPPGEYTFKVKSKNADGIQNAIEASVSFHIEPPFWQNKWFRSLLLVLLLSLTYIIFKNRIEQIRKEEARKTELQHIRSQAEMIALKAQINPHFIFNCLNTVDSYVLSNQKKAASDFLQTFSKLMRLVLENSGEELVPFEKDLEALKLYTSLEEERFEHTFTTIFDIDRAILDKALQIPPMLLQPFLENAILHGLRHQNTHPKTLIITAKLIEETVHISINDSGIGRQAANKLNKNRLIFHKSKGLELTINRIKALGEFYNLETSYEVIDHEIGTEIKIKIPKII